MKEGIYLSFRSSLEDHLCSYRSSLYNLSLYFFSGLKQVIHSYIPLYNPKPRALYIDISQSEHILNHRDLYIVKGEYEDIIYYLQELRSNNYMAVWDQNSVIPTGNKPMWKRRVSVVEAIYADLIVSDLRFSVNQRVKSEDLTDMSDWIDFERQIFKDYLDNKYRYMEEIQSFLKEGWELNRINTIAVSILLEAVSEFRVLSTPKVVLISQSVKTAKNYCDSQEYRIVNGLLERMFA